jgi:hypothetical protein
MKKIIISILTLFSSCLLPPDGSAQTSGTSQSKQQSGVEFRVGQKVEAFNSGWWKATIIEVGTGEMAGYLKVHYDNYSSASDQYLAVKNIRPLKNKQADNYGAGPRNGRYTIRSYGGNIYNPIILGYFDLKNEKYTYYDAGENLIGAGTFSYNATGKQISWLTGALKKYNPDAPFEITREGKTHNVQLKRGTSASNSTD